MKRKQKVQHSLSRNDQRTKERSINENSLLITASRGKALMFCNMLTKDFSLCGGCLVGIVTKP